MSDLASTLVTLGGLLIAGLVADALGRRTALPRVSILLPLGFGVGPTAHMTLVMVGFLLGRKLGRESLRGHGQHLQGLLPRLKASRGTQPWP